MPSRAGSPWRLLLVIPFVGVLWVPFYNSVEPRLGGIPYFYWYQFAWIAIGAALTAFVYLVTREREPEGNATAGDDARGSGFER